MRSTEWLGSLQSRRVSPMLEGRVDVDFMTVLTKIYQVFIHLPSSSRCVGLAKSAEEGKCKRSMTLWHLHGYAYLRQAQWTTQCN